MISETQRHLACYKIYNRKHNLVKTITIEIFSDGDTPSNRNDALYQAKCNIVNYYAQFVGYLK